MKSLGLATALLILSCSSPAASDRVAAPRDLHEHLGGARRQVTPIYASPSAIANVVSAVLAAQFLQLVDSEVGDSWGRVSAVDVYGFKYVLSWEPAVSTTPGNDCVLLLVSCDPGQGAVSVGQLAQAVREAAERTG